MTTPLWEIETSWIEDANTDSTNMCIPYRNWKDFVLTKPYRHWKPYILASWSWKKNMMQIVFVSPEKKIKMAVIEFPVLLEEEPVIRQWLKSHMPRLWTI